MTQNSSIKGATRLYAILADPVSQVGTPGRINPRLFEAGIDAVLVPMQVNAEDLESVFYAIKAISNFDGLVFTIPHKIAALGLMDRLTERAKAIGAINVARRCADGTWIGDNLDGAGCLAAIRSTGFEPQGSTVRQIGAGGAGRAVAFALAQTGVARVEISDLDSDRAASIAFMLHEHFPGIDAIEVKAFDTSAVSGLDAVINCSPLGSLDDDPYPLSLEALGPETFLMDIILKPAPSRWLAAAVDMGFRAASGQQMIDAQIGPMIEFFKLVQNLNEQRDMPLIQSIM